jgi:ubiquinone/menaquinone biosynthesis C-methylase UbiE
LLEELGASNIEMLMEGIKHFTEKEAEKRDKIVLNYFGEEGVKRITEAVVNRLLSPPKLKNDAKILDVGAGSGFFTIKVADKLRQHLSKASFYAMDITPAMLKVLAIKATNIVPFLGIAENITESIKHARKYLNIPEKFDAIFSTLTLHHCLNIEKVFESIKKALNNDGKAVVVDICEHPFEEFREELGDIHLGFNPLLIKKIAEKFFPNVHVEKMAGICCECSGRSAELFVAYMTSV